MDVEFSWIPKKDDSKEMWRWVPTTLWVQPSISLHIPIPVRPYNLKVLPSTSDYSCYQKEDGLIQLVCDWVRGTKKSGKEQIKSLFKCIESATSYCFKLYDELCMPDQIYHTTYLYQ